MKRMAVLIVALFAVFGASACQQMRETPAEGADRLLAWSADTVENFAAKPELKDFASHIPGAHAVLILPAIVKAGFFVGAEVGSGVLIARDPGGRWGYPAFYTLGAASFGLQFGVQDTETVLIIRNEGALQAIIRDQGKFGADLGITAGLYGAGMEASTTTNLRFDVLAFTNNNVCTHLARAHHNTQRNNFSYCDNQQRFVCVCGFGKWPQVKHMACHRWILHNNTACCFIYSINQCLQFCLGISRLRYLRHNNIIGILRGGFNHSPVMRV